MLALARKNDKNSRKIMTNSQDILQ